MKEKKVSFFRWFFVEEDSAHVIVYLVLLFVSAVMAWLTLPSNKTEYVFPLLLIVGLILLVLEVICYFADYWWEP